MKDLLAKLAELDKDIKTINETTNPLGETASMNISMTGDNADEVAQLVNIMRTGNTPDAKQIGPMDMPPSDHMPMDKALSIVKMPMDGPMDMDGPMHGMDGPTDSPMDDMPQMDPKDDEADEDMSGGFSSSTTEPDEQYFDTQTMTHDLAGGINRTKKQHAPAADGDNPIAVEDDLDAQIESIKDELYAALAEKTGKDKKSPPDYPDLDNDGNKEEPMSQAIAQRDDDKEDTDEADTSYSITGKSKEANAELARLAELSGISAPEADIDEWETDPEEHNQAAIESWHDEVVSAITSRNITFPIAEPKIQKVADVVADDWGDQGPSEDVVLSIINGENDQTTQDTMEAGSDEISRDEVHNYAAKVLPAIADKIMSGKYSEDQVISLLLKKGMLDSKEFDFSGALVPTTKEASTEDTSYSIKGKSEEANAELARIANNVDEWETDPEEHNQAAIESWHDEVVSAITDRNITFPIADNEIQKIADDVVDDWSNGNGPDEHTILSIIDNENSQVNQDQKDEATLEHEATLEAIRNISFR